MNKDEREKEIEKLRNENKKALSTPLMSEGNISPFQVSRMSERQKREYQENAQTRLRIEAKIKELQRSDEQIEKDEYQKEIDAAKSRILQASVRIEYLTRLGSGSRGKIRPKYQREIDKENEVLDGIYSKYPQLQENNNVKLQ